jgi:D-serine deaminase-like pyridoxal phosphate-dependent protein
MTDSSEYERLKHAVRGERMPHALVDLPAFDANLDRCVARLNGKRLRIATKSVRSPELLRRLLDRGRGACRGLMCFAVSEAEWLIEQGFDDLLVAYPSVQAADVDAIARATAAGKDVSIVVDSIAHLEALASAGRAKSVRCRAVIELDLSWRIPGLHFGVRRSPLRSVEDVLRLLRAARRLDSVEVVGLMAYEAHLAGVPDRTPGAPARSAVVRALKRLAAPAAARLRAETVAAARAEGFALGIVNGGGTGSLPATAAEPAVTEVTAGSAFFDPHLFDGVTGLELAPACFFACQVVRAPDPGIVTCHGGGYVASGEAGPDRLPVPWLPAGLELLAHEGAGEVQTPLRTTRASVRLAPGDPVFFRHAKAGELAERFNELLLVDGDRIIGRAKTYRGHGLAFL